MRYDAVDNILFVSNRNRLVNGIIKNSLVIINSNDQMPRNGDQYFPFRQNSDLFYLCGIEQEKTILILCPYHMNEKFHEALFIIRANKKLETWEGHKYTKEEATLTSGIKNVYYLDELETVIKELAYSVDNIYLNSNEYPKFFPEVESRDDRFGKSIRKKYPNHQFNRLAPVLTELRLIKDEIEIDLIKQACEITNNAFYKILKGIHPRQYEYEMEAILIAEFVKNKANGHAYAPIIAAGINACTLHYVENDSKCEDGDLLLMDFGAEYANYAADCTRTIPVNGKFTERQKQVYQAVLKVLKQAMKLMIPGNTINKLNNEVNGLMEKELINLGLLSADEVKNQIPDNPPISKYMMHGISHFIGLDVHDVGSKDEVFRPGMVLTCEPGIYITEEKIGIRLENDILITKNGQINLMESIPIEIDEIEKLMTKK